MKMKISWIKEKNDNENFRIPEKLGFDVFRLEEIESVDNKIEELIGQHYNTIILSNEAAGCSESIIKKYKENDTVTIIISPRKENDIGI